jgi:hypothetical protein
VGEKKLEAVEIRFWENKTNQNKIDVENLSFKIKLKMLKT